MRHPLLLLLFFASVARAEEPLRNADVLRLHKAGVPALVIVEKIRASATDFDVTSDALITLTTAGVPEPVLQAMLHAARPSAAPAASAAPAPPAASHRPDLLVWKQECARSAFPDALCRPGEATLLFGDVTFYERGARLPAVGGMLFVSRDALSGYTRRELILSIPWERVTGFCTEFAYRRLFYFNTSEGQYKLELHGPKEHAVFLQRLIASAIPTIPDCAN
ncbi:MAG TPA: hypothetical protein VGO08_04015 [Burkholderiales bacterium]|jgi:hypothetical protein|nr:hypothetical protein [Burkholderiales bacterium]